MKSKGWAVKRTDKGDNFSWFAAFKQENGFLAEVVFSSRYEAESLKQKLIKSNHIKDKVVKVIIQEVDK
jgi:hypothetical protein